MRGFKHCQSYPSLYRLQFVFGLMKFIGAICNKVKGCSLISFVVLSRMQQYIQTMKTNITCYYIINVIWSKMIIGLHAGRKINFTMMKLRYDND